MTTIHETDAPPAGVTDGEGRAIRYAQFHHNNFFTTRLEEMRTWYATVLGMKTTFAFPLGCWMTNDRANHRLALTAVPGLTDDPDKRNHARLHHQAFEFAEFDDLNDTYVRLRGEGIVPAACLDHGMTFSYYYVDPDFNYVEMQIDNFGDWEASAGWMRTSPDFAANPVGAFVDPDKIAAARAEGVSFEEIRRRVWETDDFRPDEFPDMGGPPPREGDPPLPVKW
ncbi:MAG TPA: VOC family protein [Baekduia sp.]|nr:VOC family protein [Baekduia sp.]